jgi:uncharacterized protein YdiU (UPF0061 family)
LSSLVDQDELLAELNRFPDLYQSFEIAEFRKRLGLQSELSEDSALVTQLLKMFSNQAVDMNRFFRALSEFDYQEGESDKLEDLVSNKIELKNWLSAYKKRLEKEVASYPIRSAQMKSVNPEYILRNYMAQEAINLAADGDFSLIEELIELLRNPGIKNHKMHHYAASPPSWAGSICLTCSS